MNWDDLKDSSEYAEAVTLVASLIAAIVALKKAQNDENNDAEANAPKDALQVDDLEPKPSVLDAQVKVDKDLLMKPLDKMGYVLISLGAVVFIQLAIILFIAYRLM